MYRSQINLESGAVERELPGSSDTKAERTNAGGRVDNTNSDRATGLVRRLEDIQKAVMASLTEISESELHTARADGEWTVAEVCAHVIEMQTLWLEKIANAAKDPDLERSAAQIDRRTAEVAAHADDDIETILRRLGKANAKAIDILSGIPGSTFDTQTNRGTAEGAFKALVLRHLSEHAEQITETRATVKIL